MTGTGVEGCTRAATGMLKGLSMHLQLRPLLVQGSFEADLPPCREHLL